MRPFYISLFVFATICALSCRKDFEYAASNGRLEFSRDTVFLDTIFSNIGSSTYTLKVYNRSKEDILIPKIGLAKGQESGYRLNVDGVAGKTFSDVPLRAKDSLFIFIETTFNVAEVATSNFLYTDRLEFDKGSLLQEVPLVTLVQDAVFLFPTETGAGNKETVSLGRNINGEVIYVEGFELRGNQLNFDNQKPYVIYGYAIVPDKMTLKISAGTRVYFHKDSGILVSPEGRLQIRGEISTDSVTLEKEVIFEGDRLEPELENVSGQWSGVWITSGSAENNINHLTVKNATVGIRVEGRDNLQSPTLTIKNTQIYNSSTFNLWGTSAYIRGENLVLGSSGSSSLFCDSGGDYSFVHTTIANYWTDSFRTDAALSIEAKSGATDKINLIRADFINCIIHGNSETELSLNESGSEVFNYLFRNCLIRFDGTIQDSNMNSLYNFEDNTRYQNVLFDQKVDFINANNNNFRLAPNSQAIDKGDSNFALEVPLDLLGRNRTVSPDIGAYEFITED